MKIVVDITEILSRGITVEAESIEEALETVEKAYRASEYVLDESDFCGVEFSIADNTDDNTPQVVTLDKGFDPRSLVLIKGGNEANTLEGRMAQVSHAAYIDGYITASGELSRFLTRLWKTDSAAANVVAQALKPFSKQQSLSYNTMCDRLNDKASWDEELLVDAVFTSVWNGNIALTTACKVNTETKEVFDIQTDNSSLIETLHTLEREYITINDTDYGVYMQSEAEEGDYWYAGSDDEP